MSWCLNCKAEYKEGITTCPDCGNKLIDYESKVKANIDTMEAMEPILLYSISNQTEESMIVSLLEDANIPVLIKNRGIGGYMKIYMGYSVYGSEIYVDKNDFEKAKELIDANFAESNSEDMETETDELEEKDELPEIDKIIEKNIVEDKNINRNKFYQISKQWTARLILIIMLLTIIIAFVVNNI